jgi:hypothetical protein
LTSLSKSKSNYLNYLQAKVRPLAEAWILDTI